MDDDTTFCMALRVVLVLIIPVYFVTFSCRFVRALNRRRSGLIAAGTAMESRPSWLDRRTELLITITLLCMALSLLHLPVSQVCPCSIPRYSVF